jgi:pantothenate synthetase
MIRHFFWIAAQGGVIDYAKAVSKYDLTPRDHIQKGETLLAIAVFFDKVRLIDNIEL